MVSFTYHCKKNGLDYQFNTDLVMNAQDEYAWRRGVREYMDNYHASLTKEGITSVKKGVKSIAPWKDEAEYTQTVTAYCNEALHRFNTGDVPGERVAASPAQAITRLVVAELIAKGYSADQIVASMTKQMAKATKAAA